MEERLEQLLKEKFGRGIDNCTKMEIFDALMRLTREELKGRPQIEGKKKLYYISAEFLIGKLLSNNLINLGIYDSINEILEKHKISLSEIEEMELEPSLGNGGLGRLAACFLDSIATLGLPGDGVGLNYHFGLFRQEFFHNKQKEVKNPWISENSWLERQPVSFRVPFKHFTLRSVLYDIIVPGYENGCNRLHLFDLDTVDETMVGNENINFQKENIQKNLTLFLYPDDSDVQGQLLRIYQQYFMVSNAAQLILKECEDKGVDLHRLNEHVVVQINDTHPSMVIPELIRLLQERGFMMDEAIEVVEKTCAYTNHTILAEALEKWPVSYLEQVAPQLMPIIRELDARVKARYADEAVHIIDKDQKVHMEILKRSELKPFCDIYPEKFNNKTNGITFRRWLKHCNPELAALVEELAGREVWKDSGRLEELMKYRKNKEILDKLERIKKHNKKKLCRYLYETQNLSVDPDSVFDIQIKRLHEYKRQQMNALYVIYKYLEIKSGKRPERPITVLFGAKAAPAYTIAKDIIHLILCLQQLLERDPEVSPWFRVAMVENYNVTKASKLIPAADISEQISLASKEASGTGNMKFMLNGAVTLGTEDGANVEIHELVGDDNIYIFGKKPAEVIKLYEEKGYRSRSYYENDPQIRELVDFIVSEEVMRLGDPICLDRLHHELINKDWFMTLLDLKEYIQVRDRMYRDYEDRDAWNEKALVNIARAGFFSSDRTIEEYNRDIWHLK